MSCWRRFGFFIIGILVYSTYVYLFLDRPVFYYISTFIFLLYYWCFVSFSFNFQIKPSLLPYSYHISHFSPCFVKTQQSNMGVLCYDLFLNTSGFYPLKVFLIFSFHKFLCYLEFKDCWSPNNKMAYMLVIVVFPLRQFLLPQFSWNTLDGVKRYKTSHSQRMRRKSVSR